jgi:hypothetical protein
LSRLHRAPKISDYRFRRVLEQFVHDAPATEAAKATGLSINSVHALYRKLRVFFFEVGAFQDFYAGADPETYQSEDPGFERALLSFHLARYARRHGLKSPATEPPYHFAESCWRYDFYLMMQERPSEAVFAMMQRHLLELIKLCGPIGAVPRKRLEGIQTVMRHADERIDWFRRNAPSMRDDQSRAELSAARAITDKREQD